MFQTFVLLQIITRIFKTKHIKKRVTTSKLYYCVPNLAGKNKDREPWLGIVYFPAFDITECRNVRNFLFGVGK